MTIAVDVAACVELALGIPAILSHQIEAGAPRPAATYATVLPVSATPASASPHRVMVAGSGEKTLSELQIRTIQVDVYGPGAEALAVSLSRRLQRLDVQELAFARGINVQGQGEPIFAPVLRDTEHEGHAQAEIQAQRREADTEPRELIETIQVDVDVEATDETPLETVSATADVSP